jgi:hypothetical protein
VVQFEHLLFDQLVDEELSADSYDNENNDQHSRIGKSIHGLSLPGECRL